MGRRAVGGEAVAAKLQPVAARQEQVARSIIGDGVTRIDMIG